LETHQEVTGRDPEEQKDSRTTAGAVRNQLNNPTIAGEKRHTVNELRNPESSSAAVVTGQAPVTQQPQSEISLFGKDPDKGGPGKKGDNAAGYACRKKDYDNQPRKTGYSGKGYNGAPNVRHEECSGKGYITVGEFLIGTCEASIFDSNSNRPFRFYSIRK